MKYTRLLMLAKQLRKCRKLSKGYNKPEWSSFLTIVKQQHKLDEVSYQKLFDILKQYPNEVNELRAEILKQYPNKVNELRAERLARNANPLALVASAQANQDPYYGVKGSVTSSNSRNKNVDTTPWFKNDNQSGQFRNQRTVNVAGARENVGSLVVQQSGIQCFNCREFGHFAKECKKPKRVEDFAYHKEKMLLCKQAEQATWKRFRRFLQLIQAPILSQWNSNTCLVETDDSNVIPDSPDMCEDDIQNGQNDVKSDDERVTLANLIPNLKPDVDENKRIQKQLKKANTTLA
nr:hypothetical protein [Tanacetum cinerariifolium]